MFKQNVTRPSRPKRHTLYKMQYSIFLHYFYMTTLIYTGSTIRCAGVPYSQIFFSLHSIYYGHSELEFVRQLQWRRTRNYRNDNKVKVISVKKGSMLPLSTTKILPSTTFFANVPPKMSKLSNPVPN